ncbi:Bromodomain-containing protein 4, partial [Globisporangium splendens]
MSWLACSSFAQNLWVASTNKYTASFARLVQALVNTFVTLFQGQNIGFERETDDGDGAGDSHSSNNYGASASPRWGNAKGKRKRIGSQHQRAARAQTMDEERATDQPPGGSASAAPSTAAGETVDAMTSSSVFGVGRRDTEANEARERQNNRPPVSLVPTRAYGSSDEEEDEEEEDDAEDEGGDEKETERAEVVSEPREVEGGGRQDEAGHMGSVAATVDEDATRSTEEERFEGDGGKGDDSAEELGTAGVHPGSQTEQQSAPASDWNASSVAAGEQSSDASSAQASNKQNVPKDARKRKSSASASSAPTKKLKQKMAPSATQRTSAIEEMEVSIDSLRKLAEEIGYETTVNVQVSKPSTQLFRLQCKIVHGNKKKSPIFVVELEDNAEIVFRSYVASKAWKKALTHFESLTSDEFEAAIEGARIAPAADAEPVDFLTPDSGEDGFGLLRRNITRALEGLRQVLKCKDYQFWEERHVVNAEVHSKLRAKLKKQVKEYLKSQKEYSKEEMKRLLSQDVLVLENSRSAEECLRIQQQEERERREAEKRSVREAARKLLEIEMKAQEDAKEALKREKEERRNAILEAKMEVVRQKEARKEAARLAKEEEKRMREEEKEIKRALKEEEKRKKIEEKENSMKRRIEELRERRKMREEQKSILENGVVTTSTDGEMCEGACPDRNFQSSDGFLKKKRTAATLSPGSKSHILSARKQHLALLKFVEEEKERRRKIRVLEKRYAVEKDIWTSVKEEYCREKSITSGLGSTFESTPVQENAEESKLMDFVTPVAELNQVPAEIRGDVLFAWDFISTFADCLRLTAIPSLAIFIKVLTLGDGSSPVGDGKFEEDSLGRVYAGFHTEIVKLLFSEYFPILQTGTRLEEFYRTRPLNALSWPELARQVCLLAIEAKHPSADDQLIKSLKGSKSYRDDTVVLPLRHKLEKRGIDLLKGVQYQDSVDGPDHASQSVQPSSHDSTARQTESTVSASSSKFYGVVLADGISSKIELEEKEMYIVVKSVFQESEESSEDRVRKESSSSVPELEDAKDDNASSIKVGDILISVNGVNVKGMTLAAFTSLISGIAVPHGLLLSSTSPPVKPQLKHIPTTMNSSKLKRCAHVLKLLRTKEIASPFNQPVDGDLYPDYYSGIIAEPMDLGTIAEKLEDEDYENDDDVESFVDDVALVWKNCYTYNSVKAEISSLARKLSVIFNRLMNDWVYTNVNRHLVSSEEDHCRNCQTNHVKDRLLLCDRCDAAYHTFCLSSPLSKVPTGEWFCPLCISDPTFSPDQFKKKQGDNLNGTGKTDTLEPEIEYSEFEKRVLAVIELLSKENYSDLTIVDRVNVLRVLCELLQGTTAVESVYQSIEEKAVEARRGLGEALADLNREWDVFAPAELSHTIERTNKFFIDGVEHELTDELLEYLHDKAQAELDGRPIPPLPESAISRLYEQHGVQRLENEEKVLKSEPFDVLEEEVSGDSGSDADEEQLLETFGDRLLASSPERETSAADLANFQIQKPATCDFCGLEDGILNGALISCRRCPVTHQVAPLNHFEIPDLAAGGNIEGVFKVRRLTAQECATVHLTDVSEGVQLDGNSMSHGENVPSIHGDADVSSLSDGSNMIIYAINDRVVHGMGSAEMLVILRRAEQPIFVYLSCLPGDALKACVSIVKSHSIPLGVQLEVSQSAVFVQSFQHSSVFPFGYAELSRQILPGDMLLMINDVPLLSKAVPEVEDLLRLEHELDAKYIVAMRVPCGKMKQALENWDRETYSISAQQVKRAALKGSLMPSQPERKGQVAKRTKATFDVTFYDGPLGLALSLENRGVIVKSLNDQPNGALGQASLSRQISRGDLVEKVNGQTYGPLRDLSQFTSFLLSLPRPLVITFSREVPVEEVAQKMEQSLESSQLKTLVHDADLLRKSLGFSSDSTVKTFRVDNVPLPFMASEFLGSICIVSTNGSVACESLISSGESQSSEPTRSIAVGDRIVGLNGKSTAGLNWASLQSLCAEMLSVTTVYVHLVPHTPAANMLIAHKACAQTANAAWSECEHLRPKIVQANNFELFLNWTVVPRTLSLGRCRGGYRYYRFCSDRQRIYLQSETKQWFVCDGVASFSRFLTYLEQDHKDAAIARRIRATFHYLLHGKTSARARQKPVVTPTIDPQQFCCEYSELPYLSWGPFALKKETSVSVSEFDIERHAAHMSYRGRTFYLGEFSTQQQAEIVLQHAESLILSTGYHIAISGGSLDSITALFPRLSIPTLAAEAVLKRSFARKYEYNGGVLDSNGKPKLVPLSQSVYHVLRRGLRAELIPAIPSVPPSGFQVFPSAHDQMKRKLSASSSVYAAEQAKRSRYHMEGALPRTHPGQQGGNSGGHQQPLASAAHSHRGQEVNALKRSLQPLVDQGRAMLAAWNQFAVSPTVQASNGLAYTCLSSFEEVKKAVSRVLVDPNGVLPDSKTFVCLHHAFVVGLICAMATQSLTSSRKTTGDSALVKQIADAFATAILSCMDPSTMLRSRALNGFAVVAKHCEHQVRPNDLSEELHHVANFALQFFRTTQYLANGNFEDTSKCRPIFSSLSRGVETLPASFLQQLKLLENIRETFARKVAAQPAVAASATGRSAPPSSLKVSPYSVVLQQPQARIDNTRTPPPQNNAFPRRIPDNMKEVYIHVTFGHGPLGIVINYSNHGTIIVTEFSSDNGVMGQAQASGKIFIGDEIFSVNGNYLETIGMEGFKATVANGGRPLQVTFRRYVSPIEPIGLAQSEHGVNLRRQAQNAASVFDYAPVSTMNSDQQVQYTSTMVPQRQQSSGAPFEPPQVAADGYFAGAGGMSGAGLYSQPQAPNAAYNSLVDSLSPFPFDATQNQPSGTMAPVSYGMGVPSGVSPYMGSMPAPFPSGPSGATFNGLPQVLYDEPGTSALPQPNQWRSSPPRNYGVEGNMAPMPGYSNGADLAMNPGLPVGGVAPQQFGVPSGYPPQGQRAPPLPSMGDRGNGASYSDNALSEYGAFAAPNDPNIAQSDGEISYYDANETTYRSGFDFAVDTSTTPQVSEAAAGGISDVETELVSPSVSQMTTPAQSDTEEDDGDAQAQRERQRQDAARLSAISSALRENMASSQVAPAGQLSDSAMSASGVSTTSTGSSQVPSSRTQEGETADAAALGRRSTRVPKRITSNIADMYNPEFLKNAASQAGAELEVTDGEVGELATELLELFQGTIRRAKPGVPRSIIFLKAQLLTMEAAIPRDAFRAGRWGRPIRAAWAEMVYGCDSSYTLLEAILFLESNIEAEWLDSCWKASPLQTARNALSTATIASAAMRLFALDDALSYIRTRKTNKRKSKAPTTAAFASSSIPGYAEPQDSEAMTHPSQLPFISRLTPGTIELVNTVLHRIHAGQRDKTMSPYMYRKAKAEAVAVTSLSDSQIEQWIKLYSQQVHHQPSRLTVATSGSGAHGSNAQVGRQNSTPKRKHAGGSAAPSSPSAAERPTRKRKNNAGPAGQSQFVELRCYQMKTPAYQFHLGVVDATLKQRLDLILTTLLKNELALAFAEPVNPRYVPGYTDIIKNPMDLGTIKTRIVKGYYEQRPEQVIRDVNLVWENCFTFNRLDAEISKCANRLRCKSSCLAELFGWVSIGLTDRIVSQPFLTDFLKSGSPGFHRRCQSRACRPKTNAAVVEKWRALTACCYATAATQPTTSSA